MGGKGEQRGDSCKGVLRHGEAGEAGRLASGALGSRPWAGKGEIEAAGWVQGGKSSWKPPDLELNREGLSRAVPGMGGRQAG